MQPEHPRGDLDVVAVVSAGGVIGSLARYAVSRLVPHAAGTFPWATFGVNVLGCALIGALMVYALQLWRPNRLLRHFLGTGILGGFTTFSAFAVETRDLAATGHAVIAAAYLVASVVAGLLAVQLGTLGTRHLAGISGPPA